MLPVAFQSTAGIVLVAVGLLACFAGYRLLRAVLTIYGFVLGALFASSLVAPSNVPAMLIALAVGGIAGALVLFAGYFAGVMLVGAALGALVLHGVWLQARGTEPGALLIILFAAIGAAAALYAQRLVVILATAFGGAQTAVAGVLAVLARQAGGKQVPGADDVWIGHLAPTTSVRQWPFLAWVALGLVGTLVQLSSGRSPARRRRR